MPFVLDASVTLSWHFPDERNAAASDQVLQAFPDETAVVPPHWRNEICNIALAAERRGRSSARQTTTFLGWLDQLPIAVVAAPAEEDALTLGRRHRLTFYDALYLAVAMRDGLPLATLDRALADAARREGVILPIE